MKKIFTALFFLLLLFASCSAENSVEQTNSQIHTTTLEQANADISQIDITFCDETEKKSITYILPSGWYQDICVEATNISDKDIEIIIWFVDGTVTNDQQKNKACMQQWEDKIFWQYVTWFAPSFTVPANSFVTQHAKLMLPKWITWKIAWCLVYYTQSVKVDGQENLSVLMRKANFIDIEIRKKISFKKYSMWIGIAVLLIYYLKKILFSNKTKKLPQG